MNWQLQYVIGFVMLSTMEVDMSEEIRTKRIPGHQDQDSSRSGPSFYYFDSDFDDLDSDGLLLILFL